MNEPVARKKSDLLPRLVTAAVGVPILLALAHFGPNWTLWLLFALAAAIGAWEYVNMTLRGDLRATGWAAVLGTFAIVTVLYWAPTAPFIYATVSGAVLGTMLAELFGLRELDASARRLSSTLAALLYCSALFSGLLLLVRSEQPMAVSPTQAGWLLLPMFVVFFGDTGAYFAGRAFGRRKLAPRVSPGKTWEGAIGGAIASVAGGFVGSAIYFPEFSPGQVVLLSLPAAIIGQTGDLCESLIKRATGYKDSGRILYGHGGMLDRVDALIFAAPWFVFARHLAGI